MYGMYELPALEFVSAVTEVRRLATILEGALPHFEDAELRERMAATIATMRDHLATIGDRSSWAAAERFQNYLRDPERSLPFSEVKEHLRDIESRFADHLGFVRLFVLRSEQLPLLGSAVELLGEPTASRFPSIWFDCEEVAKCICVLRPTAAVFHCMRILEIGIRAFAARLGIPDPVKPAERNWVTILRLIKGKIDSTYPATSRMPGSEGAFLEWLYATLDAVKNPWRNETVHVEGVYTDGEAQYLMMNTIAFIQKMASGFGESGYNVNEKLPLAQT